jgi:uncharacterized protein YqeY
VGVALRLEEIREVRRDPHRDNRVTAVWRGREELAEQERLELAIIEGLLPQLADEATTLGWVREAIAASGATSPRDMGKAMGALMKAHKSDIDGALARRLLEQVLAGAAG